MRISDWSSDVCSSDLLDARHLDGQPLARPAEAHELRGDAELDAAVERRVAAAERDLAPADAGAVPVDLAGQHVHARRADEVADEGVRGPLAELLRRADLHPPPLVHQQTHEPG